MLRAGTFPYAAYFAGWFCLWPIVSYAGGQGYTGMVGFLALPVLFFARPRQVPIYAICLTLFLLWAVISVAWSPANGSLVTGNVFEGTFGVSGAALRISLTSLAMVGVLFAMSQLPNGENSRSFALVMAIIGLHGFGVLVTALAMPQILALFAPLSDPIREMPQNLMRNANAFVLLLPILMAWLWWGGQTWRRGLAILLVPLTFFAVHATGSDAGALAVCGLLLAMGLAVLLPRYGLSVLLALSGLYTLCAPLVIGIVSALARESGVPLSLSSWSRLYAWDATRDEIAQKPVFGQGLEGSETWNQTFSSEPDKLAAITADTNGTWDWASYGIVPGHPHNMPLQIWADTGLVGAVLFASTLFALAWRFAKQAVPDRPVQLAACGLLGASLSYVSVSYSMWNEAFWAGIALAVSCLILLARQRAVAAA